MTITILLAATDLSSVKLKRLSMNVFSDQAVVELCHKERRETIMEAKIWMWLQGGTWRFGWSVEFTPGYKATEQFKDKIKDELHKILLPYFDGSIFDGSLSST